MQKVLVLGYFGQVSHKMEGQTVKTRNISRILKEIGCDVFEFDTESFRYDKFSIFKLINSLRKADKICILPAHNNLKWIFPIVYLLSIIFRYKILYFTIGGRLHIYLKTLPLHRFMLRRIECIFNETHLLGQYLQEMYGFKNLEYCPNVKFIRHVHHIHHTQGSLKLVFLARIVKEKGLDVIFNYCSFLLANKRENVTIDFYGMIDPKDELYFYDNVAIYPFVHYLGIAQQNDIPEILEQYDAMLFPTHYPTEGIPGSVLDAYIAGIPVIASNWVYASELIENDRTGIIVKFEDNYDEFIIACESLILNEDKLQEMKYYAHKKSGEYYADNAKSIIIKYLS